METYKKYRDGVLIVMDRAEDILSRCSTFLGVKSQDNLPELRQKLERNQFNLVFTGGFQTGKSTVFSYLCEGRELSPIGSGGGGIPTSAARVSAMATAPGEQEFVVVHWRSKAELLASLGGWLVPEYMPARIEKFSKMGNPNCLDETDVNLDNLRERERLADIALSKLQNPGAQPSGVLDQARMALIVAKYYAQFVERIQQKSARYNTPEDVVRLASYPPKWEHRWAMIKDGQDIKTVFSDEEVTFVFVRNVEYHIDAPLIRNLGCTVIDCPGLSASTWDSDIARECMKEADAVLYMLRGDKTLSEDDRRDIDIAAQNGAENKLLFGANLRKPPFQWNGCKEETIFKLQQSGYNVPPFFDFHAGVALSAYELMYMESNSLSAASKRALELELEREGEAATDENCKMLLENRLNDYLAHFTKTSSLNRGKTLRDFKQEVDGELLVNYNELVSLSGLPAFLSAAQRNIQTRKTSSLLRDSGTLRVIALLKATLSNLQQRVEAFNQSREKKMLSLEQKLKELSAFEQDYRLACDSLYPAFSDLVNEQLANHYRNELMNQLQQRRNDIIGLTSSSFIGTFEMLFRPDKAAKAQQYAQNLSDLLIQCIQAVIESMRGGGFVQQAAYQTAIARYRDLTEQFDDKIKAMDANSALQLQLSSVGSHVNVSVSQMIMPRAYNILESIERNNTGELLLDIVSFGVNRLFKSPWTRAEAAINEKWEEIKQVLLKVLTDDVFYVKTPEVRGPLQQLWDLCDNFRDKLRVYIDTKREELNALRSVNDDADSVAHCTSLIHEVEAYIHDVEDIDNKIQNSLK